MSNSQQTKLAGAESGPAVNRPEERPKTIDYWNHLSMHGHTGGIDVEGSFMSEEDFNELRLVQLVKKGYIDQVRNIRDRVEELVIAKFERQLNGESLQYHWDDRIRVITDLIDLLDMAIVGIGRNVSFYCLTKASYSEFDSDIPMMQIEFLRDGFYHLTTLLGIAEGNTIYGLGIEDYTYPYQVINEFLKAIQAHFQNSEIEVLKQRKATA